MKAVEYLNVSFSSDQGFLATIFDTVKNKTKFIFLEKPCLRMKKIDKTIIACQVLDHGELFMKNNFLSKNLSVHIVIVCHIISSGFDPTLGFWF